MNVAHDIMALINLAIFAFIIWAIVKRPAGIFFSTRRLAFLRKRDEAKQRGTHAAENLKEIQARLTVLGVDVAELLEEMRIEGAKERNAIINTAKEKAIDQIANAEMRVSQDLERKHVGLHRRAIVKAFEQAEKKLRTKMKTEVRSQFIDQSMQAFRRTMGDIHQPSE